MTTTAIPSMWGLAPMVNAHPLSVKQIEILKIICAGNGVDAAGVFNTVDMDQLLERLAATAYKTTKESMQFSVRALMRRNLIRKGPLECRRGRNRATFVPTAEGHKAIAPPTAPSPEPVVLAPGVSEVIGDLE